MEACSHNFGMSRDRQQLHIILYIGVAPSRRTPSQCIRMTIVNAFRFEMSSLEAENVLIGNILYQHAVY